MTLQKTFTILFEPLYFQRRKFKGVLREITQKFAALKIEESLLLRVKI